jgi:hypothetical protein
MRSSTALFLMIAGFPIAVVDLWLSLQSMVGIMKPVGGIDWLFVGIVSFAMTAIAIAHPIVSEISSSFLFKALWFVALLFDVTTSLVGTIWYLVLKSPYSEPVNFSKLTIDWGNSVPTAAYFAVVILIALGCVAFGKALSYFLKRNKDKDKDKDKKD